MHHFLAYTIMKNKVIQNNFYGVQLKCIQKLENTKMLSMRVAYFLV